MSRRRLGVLIAAAGLLGAVAAIIVFSGTDNERPRSSSTGEDASVARTGVAGSTRPELVRDCASRVEGRRLTANRRVDLVAGPIIFYGLREWGRVARARPAEAFRSRAGEYAPIKTITEVRADSVVTVAVAPADQRQVALLYRWRGGRRVFGFRLSEGQHVVQFRSCPASHRRFRGRGRVGPRTQYNGGFLFAGPQCLRLDVIVDGGRRPHRYVLPIGRSHAECSRP
jgi:hypothetical protein